MCDALDRWMRDNRKTATALAEDICALPGNTHVVRQTIGMIRRGRRDASKALVQAIYRVTRGDVDANDLMDVGPHLLVGSSPVDDEKPTDAPASDVPGDVPGNVHSSVANMSHRTADGSTTRHYGEDNSSQSTIKNVGS